MLICPSQPWRSEFHWALLSPSIRFLVLGNNSRDSPPVLSMALPSHSVQSLALASLKLHIHFLSIAASFPLPPFVSSCSIQLWKGADTYQGANQLCKTNTPFQTHARGGGAYSRIKVLLQELFKKFFLKISQQVLQ